MTDKRDKEIEKLILAAASLAVEEAAETQESRKDREVEAIRVSDDYFICVGKSVNAFAGDSLCYHIINRTYGVVEDEISSLPVAIVHLKQIQGLLDEAVKQCEGTPAGLASVTDIKPTEH